MSDRTVHDNLLRLGYSQMWLDCGMLTIEQLREQIKELDSDDDDNAEHYRYRTFINYFHRQNYFDNSVLKQTLQILQNDSDRAMANAALIQLLRMPTLTDEQFNAVVNFLVPFGDWAIKEIDKARQQRVKL